MNGTMTMIAVVTVAGRSVMSAFLRVTNGALTGVYADRMPVLAL